MIVSEWKEPVYPEISVVPLTSEDYSTPPMIPYKAHVIEVVSVGYEDHGHFFPQYAAIRHTVDGEIQSEKKFTTWEEAIKFARQYYKQRD